MSVSDRAREGRVRNKREGRKGKYEKESKKKRS